MAVGDGLVCRRNIIGVTFITSELTAKALDLLAELVAEAR